MHRHTSQTPEALRMTLNWETTGKMGKMRTVDTQRVTPSLVHCGQSTMMLYSDLVISEVLKALTSLSALPCDCRNKPSTALDRVLLPKIHVLPFILQTQGKSTMVGSVPPGRGAPLSCCLTKELWPLLKSRFC
jgi:hypothetical protein